ncbi:MAG: hypothetical protein MUO27_04070, partial [Sedimentisphaerales bacterium]|nr:hypothetical protein [Sedimentisphaerales bacterium]
GVLFLNVLLCSVSLAAIGLFEGHTDVGDVRLPSSIVVDTGKNEYQITASGANMWEDKDAFHFLWHRLSGDFRLATDINWVGKGKNAHRKAGWVIRQTLEANSPYIDAVVHGDGLIAMQYRTITGGTTFEVLHSIKAFATIQLERNADTFTLSVAPDGNTFQPVGSVSLALTDPVYVGLAVCSHEANVVETAVFSNVKLEKQGVVAMKERLLESTLETISIDTGERKIIYRAREHFEAPNWSRDGEILLFNSNGKLYTIPVAGGRPKLLDTADQDRCNNDHGFSPDGKFIAISSHRAIDNKSLIYVLPSTGGSPRLVTPQGPSYWHGWSPDGNTLAYCAERKGEFDIYTIPVNGGDETRLTNAPGLDDGPEYSPDGKYIFFNSVRTGLMKIWRMNADGNDQQQVTRNGEYADWFPHPSPDGKWLVFLSYDKTVNGHPANKDVTLRIMPLRGGQARGLTRLFGGQGTINVPSWSPDSKQVAFVSYRLLPSQ